MEGFQKFNNTFNILHVLAAVSEDKEQSHFVHKLPGSLSCLFHEVHEICPIGARHLPLS